MSHLVVLAPPSVAPGFALGGADAVPVTDPGHTVRLVDDAVRSGAVVVAVHHELARALPAATRRAWDQRTDVLVLSLPPDDGETTTDRHHELRELLASAVGYEISFTPERNAS